MNKETEFRDTSTILRALPVLAAVTLLLAFIAGFQEVFASSAVLSESVRSKSALMEENIAPIIDLNGPEAGFDYVANFIEDQSPVSVVSTTLTITDTDSAALQSAVVKITNLLDGADEKLEVNTSGTGLNAVYNSGTGVLKLNATGSIADYEKALRTLAYVNASQSPSTADRLLTLQVFDGNKYSNEAAATVLVEAVNDAPVLKSGIEFRFADIQEDDRSQVGNRVATFIDPAETGSDDRITDPDAGSLEGVAVIGAENGNGMWQFSTDAGVSWTEFGSLSNTSATLLDPSARIRFLPDLNFHGTTNITVRAWDQTSGSSGETGVDTSENGGTSAFSLETASVSLQVIPVNDPPVVDLNGPDRETNLVGFHLLGSGPAPVVAPLGTVDDVDNELLVSIKVTLSPRPDGTFETLEYEQTSTRLTVGPYDPATGQLKIVGTASPAEYTALLHTLTYSNTSPTPSLEARVLDFVANDGVEDGPQASTTLYLLDSNNAPVVDPGVPLLMSDISEEDDDPQGDAVGELFDGASGAPIVDDEGALRGLAIVDADNNDGQWQVSLDDGQSWRDMIGATGTSALLINEAARVRFVPDTESAGFSRTLTVRAWDQTSNFNGSEGVDVSNNGGSTAFSAETTKITVDIISVNDPPQLTLMDGIVAVYIEDNGPVVVAGPSLQVTDVDNETLMGATVSIANHLPSDADILAAHPNGSGIATNFDAQSGVLKLSGEASLSAYQAVLRSVTFENRSHDPSTHDRQVTFVVEDDLTASNNVSSTVSVESVNDLPLVDLNGRDVAGNNVAVEYNQEDWGKNSIQIAADLELQDLDDSTLTSATVTLLDRLDGEAEVLEVKTDGTNIVDDYDSATGILRLSGIENLLDYERVLRTITYANSKQRPLTKDRRVRFVVSDQEAKSEHATSRIIVIPKLVMIPLISNTVSEIREQDEPNNSCSEAYPLQLNLSYQFQAEDRHDWYSFATTVAGDVTVSLTNFEPIDGQILIASGPCDDLKRVAQNGDFSVDKVLHLESLSPGEYHIWIITDRLVEGTEPYRYNLEIEAP